MWFQLQETCYRQISTGVQGASDTRVQCLSPHYINVPNSPKSYIESFTLTDAFMRDSSSPRCRTTRWRCSQMYKTIIKILYCVTTSSQWRISVLTFVFHARRVRCRWALRGITTPSPNRPKLSESNSIRTPTPVKRDLGMCILVCTRFPVPAR